MASEKKRFTETQKMAGVALPERRPSRPPIPREEIDDEPTYEMLARGDSIGVFQFESEGMQEALRKVRPTEFDDLAGDERGDERSDDVARLAPSDRGYRSRRPGRHEPPSRTTRSPSPSREEPMSQMTGTPTDTTDHADRAGSNGNGTAGNEPAPAICEEHEGTKKENDADCHEDIAKAGHEPELLVLAAIGLGFGRG
mgnify:CR=1 FL=1